MDPAFAIDFARSAILVLLEIIAPAMITALVVGLAIGLLQALTQIQEQTLVFVPKILAIFITMLLTLPFLGEPGDRPVQPRHVVYGGLAALLDPVAARGVDLRVRLDLDGEELWLEVRDGEIVRPDRSAKPDVVIKGTAAALAELSRGAALASLEPRLHVEATRASWKRFQQVFPAEHLVPTR